MSGFEPERAIFKLTVEPASDRTVLAAAGELDLVAADDLLAELRRHLAAGPVLLDLQELSFTDSSGLRVLDTALRDAEREGWTLAVHPGLQPGVRRALELTGMLELMPFEGPAPDQPGP